jgi:DNA repair protein RecO (recombination protein O)
MSSLLTATGIVLHTVRHGETSLILTVFCREPGKLGFMAKGARGKSKLGSAAALQLLSEAQFVFYYKANRELQLLKEWTAIETHHALRADLDLLAVASAVAELVARCLREHDPHAELYDATRAVLSALDQGPASPLPLLWLFELQLFRALGFALELGTCAATGQLLAPPFPALIRYRLADGAFFRPEAMLSTHDGELSVEAFSALSALASATPSFAGRLTVSPRVQQEVSTFLARYLETHLPVVGKLRSLKALNWGKTESGKSSQ